MKAIITGASGFIGTELAKILIEKGYEVIGLSRNPEKQKESSMSFELWDGKTGDGWFDKIDESTIIINLAGENIAGRWTKKKKERILESRISAGEAVTDAIKRAKSKPKFLLQMSGIGYYGSDNPENVTEESPAGSDFLADVCVKWENSTKEVEDLGVRRVVVRLGAVLSKDAGALQKIARPIKFYVGGSLGNGKQYFSWVHEKDALNALIWFIESESASGVYNVVAPEAVTNKRLTKVIGSELRRPTFLKVPSIAVKLALGDMSQTVLNGQLPLADKLINSGFVFRFPTIQTAITEIYSYKVEAY
jgi:uncharacterized protein